MARRLGRVVGGIAVLASAGVALAACGGSGSSTSNGAGDANSTYLIGVLNSSTGSLGAVGQQEQQGMDLAVSQINAAGGVNGHTLKLVTVDDQGSVSQSTAGLKKLATSDKVSVVVGPGITADAAADAPLADQYGVPEILLVAQPSLLEGRKDVYEVPPPQTTNSKAMVDYAKQKGFTSAALIWASNPYGQEGEGEVTQDAKDAGINLVSSESWDPTKFDFTAQAGKVASEKPAAVFLYGAGGDNDGLLLKAVRDAGYKGPIIGDLTYASSSIPKTAGAAADGIVAFSSVNYAKPSATDNKFLKSFQTQYKSVPTGLSANGYVGVELAAKALEAANSGDSAAVAQAMQSVHYDSVLGSYAFTDSYHGGPQAVDSFKPVSFDSSGNYTAVK